MISRRHDQQCCFIIVTVGMITPFVFTAPSHYLQSSHQRETWLSDKVFYDLEENQENSESSDSSELCPPVPKQLGDDSCAVASCRSDTECADRQLKCCYNGCVFTCLAQVKPAPHFDWIVEPVRQLQFGQSWLVPGPDEDSNIVLCSTTPPDDDSDPLICPHGYTCIVDDVAASAEQEELPDQGHCVKIADDVTVKTITISEIQNDQPPSNDLYDTALKHACFIDEGQLLISGHSLILDGQKCFCNDKKLTCND
ncbi:WAP four-disulfide core domain protein 1-like isoform X1 [Biomphalaria glabrata]|uniref:WAP four-disulfide core domain protein 1 n=1 Tax=Biomphalaria glabrata TaxID=6526 RepID=A0A9U8DWL2_BIOGL|nr:WAP four-disulfide core domain protein 1-like isoform X1 [Biomphalaria glabrata]XP_055864855.1 WAP four-disulfide core domain protein 1-like isoform X1 [Biomphalaria glabrata]